MKRTLRFSSRNFKEVLRDPINLFFGLGFPLVLLVLLSVIQSNIPSGMPIYEIDSLAPALEKPIFTSAPRILSPMRVA